MDRNVCYNGGMQAIKIIGLLLLAAILTVIALVLLKVTPRIQPMAPTSVVTNFDECVAAGNPVMESYPRQCRTEDGRVFVEDVPQGDLNDGTVLNHCRAAGCSGQLCVSAIEADNIITTCEYRAEYACYKTAKCERQSDGNCGWTQSGALKQCLTSPPSLEGEGNLEVM